MANDRWQWQESGKAWKGVGIYHITLVVSSRQPLLGTLVVPDNDPVRAKVERTELGNAIIDEVLRIHTYYPDTRILQYCLMPDHLHFILYVTKPLPKSIGVVVRGFWQGAKRIGRAFSSGVPPSSKVPPSSVPSELNSDTMGTMNEGAQPFADPVFQEMPFIRPLSHRGQLQAMVHYIQDNPRRLALKRANPQLFRLRLDVQKSGFTFTALGNMFLLDYPQKEVLQCSRSLTQEQIDQKKRDCLISAACGTVFVSAGISEGEKQICRALREAGYPLVMLLKDGFPQPQDEHYKFYKPHGAYFEACSEGRLMLLEPKPECFEKEDIARIIEARFHDLPHNTARYHFLSLNEIAKRL